MATGRISIALALVAACGYPRPEDVKPEPRLVGGRVHGLWDGADGVVLRLQADGIDTLLTVPRNGDFGFAEPLVEGASYTVTVATNPGKHTCVVDAGGNGMVDPTGEDPRPAGKAVGVPSPRDTASPIGHADVTAVSVACTGPVGAVVLSGLWGWTFDPTEEMQTFAGSIAVQDVALTISGASLMTARVGDAAATLDEQTPPINLPLGATMVPVALTASGGLSKTYQLVFDRGGSLLDQVVYGKASNAEAGDFFGRAVALSGDTLAVGASGEHSNATGVNGNQDDNSAAFSGAVYIFVRRGTVWTQQAYLKASNTEMFDGFGDRIALSGDTLAVASQGESSSATGIDGNQADNSAPSAGAVYVFVRDGTTWTQQAYVKASNSGAADRFGASVALSGNTLAVGAILESSSATGINGNQADNSAQEAGAVYIFVRDGARWTQQAFIKASNTDAGDHFGDTVALSGDTLAVGALEASGATGINPVNGQADNSARYAGAVYVFVRRDTSWTQQAYIKASNTETNDEFGRSIALSGDTLAVGAAGESSDARGVNGDQGNNNAPSSGAVYVFVRNSLTWTQQAYLKASNSEAYDAFGASVALAGDTLAVGAIGEASLAIGIDGNQLDNSGSTVGAAYVFVRGGTTWEQRAYVKASNPNSEDNYGLAIALSGNTLVVGTMFERSGATGINPLNGQADNGSPSAGAVYVFR
jgi:drug/metabolite transporter superfamily protein YnfA